jgi:hypothetical protein
VALLSEYAKGFWQNTPDESLLVKVRELLPKTSDPQEFHGVAQRLWDEYLCSGIDVLLMIDVLRRWLEIEPDSKEAKEALGTWLLLHGPDWDVEGHQLLQEARS